MAIIEEVIEEVPATPLDEPEAARRKEEQPEAEDVGEAQEKCSSASTTEEFDKEDVNEESQQMPEDYESDMSAKELGNEAFNKGQYAEAVEHWSRGIRSCQMILSKNAYEGEQKKQIEDLLSVLNCNSAVGLLKLKRFHEAARRCDDVLKFDPKNIKAIFRKADALFQLGKMLECINTLDKLLVIEPKNGTAKQLKVKATHELTRSKNKERKMMKGVLSSMEPDPRTIQDEPYGVFSVFRKMMESCWGSFWCKLCQKRKKL